MQPDRMGWAHRNKQCSSTTPGNPVLGPRRRAGPMSRSETSSSKGRSYPRRCVSTTPKKPSCDLHILPLVARGQVVRRGAFACVMSLRHIP